MTDSRTRWFAASMALVMAASSCSGISVPRPLATSPSTTTPSSGTAQAAPPSATGVPTSDTSPAVDALPVLDDVTPPEWVPTTRAEELLQQIADADSPSVQQAVDLFDLTYGGMPGATPFTLPPGDSPGGTYVLSLVRDVRDKLAPEQRAALDALDASATETVVVDGEGHEIDPPSSSPASSSPATSAPATAIGLAFNTSRHTSKPSGRSALTSRLLSQMLQAQSDWRTSHPELPVTPIRMQVMTWPDGKTLMDAQPDGSQPQRCLVRVYPVAPGTTDSALQVEFAHELFHCMQFTWGPFGTMPAWLVEGSAQWAMLDLYRNASSGSASFARTTWFQNPGKPLGKRSYDAWPIYETLRQTRVDPYPAIKAMFATKSPVTTTLLDAGQMSGLLFRGDWSTRTVRAIQWNEKEWWLDWPTANSGDGPYRNQANLGTRGIGTFTVYGSPDYGHTSTIVTMGPKVGLAIVVSVRDILFTHADSGTVTVGALKAQKFCFEPDGCKCPDDTSSDAIAMSDRNMIFSFPADLAQPSALVKTLKWDPETMCKKKRPARASHNGDPHLATFDGLGYDVMGPGEYVTSRDPQGGFEVQVRQEPLEGLGSGASAVALGDGSHRVTFTASSLEREPSIVLRVDGSTTDLAAPTSPDGLTISPNGDHRWTVTWADGSQVELLWNVGWFITVLPSAERAARLEGLLGNADGKVLDDMRTPDGAAILELTDPTVIDAFARSWLVDDRSTLFDYQPGQSAATFANMPLPQPVPAPNDETVQQCKDKLGSDAVPTEVTSCAYDVTATGDTSFIDAYLTSVNSRVATESGTPSAPPPTTEPTGGTAPGGAVSGSPSLVLKGSLYAGFGDPGDPNAVDVLSGSLTLKAGTVLVVRANLCPTDVQLTLHVERHDNGENADAVLCDAQHFRDYEALDPSELISGENFVYIGADGVYDLSLDSDSEHANYTEVQFFADPTPTIVSKADVLSKGWTGTLQGTADAVVLPISTGDKSAKWNVTVTPDVCAKESYGFDEPGTANPGAIDVCGHRPIITMSPTGSLVVLLILFARTDTPTKVAFVPTP
jgi:hypothetical protein